jgi:hypothetical protein
VTVLCCAVKLPDGTSALEKIKAKNAGRATQVHGQADNVGNLMSQNKQVRS